MRRGILTVIVAGLIAGGCAVGDEKEEKVMRAVASANNEFAFDLYAKLKGEQGNLFYSPYSLSTALAMTWAGARGQTAEEMAEVLGLAGVEGNINEAVGRLVDVLNAAGSKGDFELSVANALWGQEGEAFRKQYIGLLGRCYGAGLHTVDFAGATEEARRTINEWVEENTKGKIKDLMKRGVLSRDTVLVLTNAIYFKGQWLSQFEKSETREMPFSVSRSQQVQAPMMYQKETFGYYEEPGLQVLEMGYEGKRLSMAVLLPGSAGGLGEMEDSLNAQHVEELLKGLRRREVRVWLPTFKMTFEAELNRVLEEMGMKEAFSDHADFSGMSSKEGLYLSNVVHKAFVDVNEEGTEAAAATGIAIGVTSIVQVPEFRADRPFVFVIRDKVSGSILFVGRLVNPVGGED